MTYKHTAKLSCKIMALYFFMLGLSYLPNLITSLIYLEGSEIYMLSTMLSWMFMCIMIFLIAFLLWVKSDKISSIMVKDIPENTESKSVDYGKISVIVFSAIGTYLFVTALPELARYLTMINSEPYKEMMENASRMRTDNIARIVGELVQLLLGLWLMLGSHGIVRFIKLMRTLGTESHGVSK